MAAAHRCERTDQHGQRQAVRQGDTNQARAAWAGHGGDHDGAGADEEEEESTDGLGDQRRPGSLCHAHGSPALSNPRQRRVSALVRGWRPEWREQLHHHNAASFGVGEIQAAVFS